MRMLIEHSKPMIGKEERGAVIRVVESGYLAEGQEVREFEKEISRYIGAKGAVATSTGTLGLHLALVAVGVKEKDEVMLPSYVCRSVLNAVLYAGARPILCDVNSDDFNISFEDAQKKRTKKTRAVIVPHMFGSPAEIDRFKTLGVYIIEDCAHAIGGDYKGKKLGSWGDLSVVSFEGTKYIVAGEGGMVLANSEKLLRKLKGLKEPDSLRPLAKYTYRMTDLQAAVGRVQLLKIDRFVQRRREIAALYDRAFAGFDIDLPKTPLYGTHTFHRYMIKIKSNINNFMKKCFCKGIKVKQPVKPFALHRYLGLSGKNFSQTEYLMDSAVSIPIYPSLKSREIGKIVKIVKEELGNVV